ncbi:bifunctional diguanylate cyclase/phosphodiesterase [Methylocaldum sp.]|uniref:bifunctional diguanylate cyclase/phosphodiesterase n=1 Tax=Methylocaldum sp. TaxID=1969727 RepID=UPI002D3B0EEE|nr:EAL domain-containing protein [Methylocaldum sp.]HYE33975.1 EAL domain-containing protein [Methylocaldum sp.]
MRDDINRFWTLRRKGFVFLSLLLLMLGVAFGALNYWNLRTQFKDQQTASNAALRTEFEALMERSADRLQRLGVVFASLGKLERLITAPHQGERVARLQEFFSSVRYELDVEHVELFDAQGHSTWRWSSSTAVAIPQERLQGVLSRVLDAEQPLALLTCQPGCSLHAFVPLLSDGRSAGILMLSQMITDLVLDLSAGAGTNLAILVAASDASEEMLGSWGLRVAALSNPQQLEPFLRDLAKHYSGPEAITSGKWLNWNDKKFTVYSLPLSQILDGGETGYLLFIADKSASAGTLDKANRDALFLIGTSLVIAEILLFLLLHAPLRRIQHLAATLPLLAHGNYHRVNERLKTLSRLVEWKDEIDILYATSIRLAHQIEEHQNTLAAERDFIQGLLDNAQVLILTQTQDGRIRTVNELTSQILGRSSEALKDARFIELIEIDSETADIGRNLEKLFSNLLHRLEHEAVLTCYNGSKRHIVWVHTRLGLEHENGIAVLSIGLDATERIQAESRIRWLANHDSLTGLHNRLWFKDELERSFAEAERNSVPAALLLFDLDHFKDVNDSSGHAAGDALLGLLANELRARARKSDVLARLGGDEFAVLMTATDQSGAECFAQDLNQRLTEKPFRFGDRSYRISASIGIALIPDHGKNVEELMANADAAMYQAKKAGRGRWHLFSHSGEERAQISHRAYWRSVIAQSLDQKRLFFHYQPVLDMATGQVAYYEALLRLTLEDGRLVLPGEYMDVILRSDLMNAIDSYVTREAIDVLGKDREARLSINLSATALTEPGWAEPLKQAVRDGNLAPERLLLEITETAAIADLDAARRIMDELTDIGFGFAMDDFGAGFASFHYLRHLPIKHVKIDRSFISRLATDEDDNVFVSALTALAHGYRQKIVAEGVENAETLIRLHALGVDLVQGFFIGRPDRYLKPVNVPMIDPLSMGL